MPYLEVQTPKGKRRLELGDSDVTVGRLPENTIQHSDSGLSRHHCVVVNSDSGRWKIRDLGSRNGTKLNLKRIKGEEVLENGDTVKIGNIELKFIDPERPVRADIDQSKPALKDPKAKKRYEAKAKAAQSAQVEATMDIDLRQIVSKAKADYEATLRSMCDSAAEQPFDVDQISLVDARGQTVHQASASGFDAGKSNTEAESIRAFRLLLLSCFRSRATDLHVEPKGEHATVRVRVDGQMVHLVNLENDLFRKLMGMVKILCEIDTSHKSTVQDGHFSVRIPGRRVDYRVSFTPVMHGQKLVIRVLDGSNAPARLHELGLLPWMYEKLRKVAIRDSGLLLVSGPTGSGKTTSLYSCLREIDVEVRNAVTIEDPVEYHLEGCTQIPVDNNQGNTFANILRSVLRQDPDVIFVGEIRDIETASVATQAAMTGHLVYSTVHARDSIGSIFRLLDLGLEPYLVANALNLVVAQRLLRVLCPSCKRKVKPTPAQTLAMGKYVEGVPVICSSQGCSACLGTGYHGRRAIFELLEVSDAIRDVILKTPTITAIREVLSHGLFTSLRQYGFSLVSDRETSFDEIDRVAAGD